jgi:glycosyltransferase involved in cell wall biosynthesis
MKKILVFIPDLRKPGGVANYYKTIRRHLDSDIDYFVRGPKLNSILPVPLAYLFDYYRFFFHLLFRRCDLYVLNTSFAKSGTFRDSIFILLLRIFKRRFIVFFRGWDKEWEINVERNSLYQKFPLSVFKHAKSVIVLADEFKCVLQRWGFEQYIYTETTVVDDQFVGISDARESLQNDEILSFLYMARVERNKGIFDAIDFFELFSATYSHLRTVFYIAGDGSALEEAKAYVKNWNITNIAFLGHVNGVDKYSALQNADIFLFPSNHGEGMPNSVLEAMACGCFIVTTQVGGIKDFFVAENMGLVWSKEKSMRSLSSDLYSSVCDRERLRKVCDYNQEYAAKNFLSNVVSQRLMAIFGENLRNND